jgi:hypothetical protein
MNKLIKGAVAVVFAGAATLGTSAPAVATSGGGGGSLVNIYLKNVASGNQVVLLQNVAVPVAAALCGVNVNVFSAQLDKGQASCPAKTTVTQIAFAKYV